MKIDSTVWNSMGDERSREMYQNRIDYSNGAKEAIERIVRSVRQGKDFIDFMRKHQDHLYIFGAGMLGQDLADTWNWKFGFQAFIDNDCSKHGMYIQNIPVISLEEIKDKKSAAIIIMNKFHWHEIEKQLRENHFCESQILNLGEGYRQFNNDQYFDLEQLKITDGECFVDCGVLDGETSLNFLDRYQDRVKEIWMFEPDKNNVTKVKKNFEGKAVDYKVIQKGVWSSATTLCFNSLGNGCAGIDENGEDQIETVKLDDALAGCDPTFIKMNIEGAELEALRGAEHTIKRCRPKLAISVYHKPEDIAEIPRLLLEYCADYKFYLRHYSLMSSETILYAL